jgi:tape measure domain-containing protein
MSGVEIKVRANARQATNELGKLERSLNNLDVRTQKLTRGFQKMAVGITAIFTGGALTKGITRASDKMTNLSNRVNLVTQDLGKTKVVMKELFDIAERSRGGVDAAAETFSRFGLALKDSGKSASQLLVVTEAVQQAAILSGSSAETAKAAIVQLGQGLSSGQLRGEELNSVLEGMPRLAQAIAEGMGIPFGELRKAAQDGLLTAEAVFDAITDGATKMETEFLTMNSTVAGLGTVFKDQFTRAIAEMDKAIGVSADIKDGILLATTAVKYLGENIGRWALLARANFTLLKFEIKFFAQDVGEFLGKLFTEDLDTKALVDNVSAALTEAYNTVVTKVGEIKDVVKNMWRREAGYIGMDEAITQVDLSTRVFTGLSTALARLRQFRDNVVGIFYEIWERIVGKSLWTGIFDRNHEEGGKAAIGNTDAWGVHLDTATGYIRSWATALIGVFEGLHFEVADRWQQMITGIEETGGLKTNITRGLSTAWKATMDTMSRGWDAFADYVYLKTGKDLPLSLELERSFDKAVELVKSAWNKTVGLIKGTPLVIAIGSLVKSLNESKAEIKGYFNSNSDQLAAVITTALAAALNKPLRGFAIRGGLIGAFLFAIGSLKDNAEFQTAAGDVARGFGKLIADAFAEDGDVVADILAGILTLTENLADEFLIGLFGEGFESDFGTKLGQALLIALGAFVMAPKLTKLLLGLGLKMVAYMFSATGAAALAAALRSALVAARTAPALVAASSALGAMIGLAIQVGIVAAVAIAADILSDLLTSATNKVVNRVKRVFSGETSEEQQVGIARDVAGSSGESASAQIANGIADAETLATLGPEALNKLKENVLGSETSLIQMGTGLFGFSTNAEKAAEVIDEALSLLADNPALAQLVTRAPESALTPSGYATGGSVRGAGTGTSDSIPAMLSNGEYVIKASAVQALGKDKLDLLNKGMLPQFSAGGYVSQTGGRLVRQRNEAIRRGDDAAVAELNGLIQELLNLTAEQNTILTEGSEEEVSNLVTTSSAAADAKALAEQYSDSFQADFQGALSQLLMSGDTKEFFTALADSFTSNIINSFTQSFTDALFGGEGGLGESLAGIFQGMLGFGDKVGATVQKGIKSGVDGASGASGGGLLDSLGGIFSGMFESISGMLSGIGGEGGFFSSLLGGIGSIFGFSQGGIVPSTSTSQAGKDSVPAMLMPGEVVLSKNDVSRMGNNNSQQQQQVYNINVSGDVSRQTRKEIVKMMPQITGGVNATNKERGRR